MPMNSLPRWLISMTHMPVPCQSSISAAAVRRTGSGSTAGPGLKLKIRMAVTVRWRSKVPHYRVRKRGAEADAKIGGIVIRLTIVFACGVAVAQAVPRAEVQIELCEPVDQIERKLT